ncbi:MAG: PAS domain S-box protein [Alphaproteobacteria bacterium]|nr:PAS domain S-box protein [Alphaproteobacteria bacterium]
MIRLLPKGSLALRFSLVSALLAGLAILMVGGVFWSALTRQFESETRIVLQQGADAEAQRIGGMLRAVTDTMASLSKNSMLATTLIDSTGRATYLIPFLHGVQRIEGVPVDIIFTDFEGATLATNGREDFTNDERRWTAKALGTGHRQATLIEGPHGPYILAAEMLIYDRTKTPEGALVYRLPLSAVRPLGSAIVMHTQTDTLPQSWEAQAMIPLDPILAPLGLHIHDTVKPPNVLQAPLEVWGGFVAAALSACALVLLFSQMAGHYLTRSLRDLESLADSVVKEGLSGKRAEETGNDEVAALARSLNVMLEKLARAYWDLEAYSHTLLNNAEKVANMGSWRWRAGFDAMEWSDKVYEILGIPAAATPSLRKFIECVAGDDRPSIEHTFRRLAETDDLVTIECCLDSGRYLHLQGKPGLGPDGTITCNGTILDVTERVVARKELIEAHRKIEAQAGRFRSLLKVASDGVHILDPKDGRLVEYSESFLHMLGYEPAQAATLTVMDWDVQFSHDELLHRMRALIEKPAVFETKHRRRDGRVLDVEINACGIELDGAKYLYASSRDISDRRKLERERQQLIMAIEQSPAAVVIASLDGNIEYVNPAFSRSTGYAREEAIGRNPRILKSGETSDEEYQAMWRTLASGQPWSGTFLNRRKDGGLFWEQAQIAPVLGEDGKITHYVAVKENITERKAAEARLRDSEERYRATFEQMAVGIAHTSFDGKLLRCNARFAEIIGYPPEEVSSLTFQQITSPDDLSRSLEAVGPLLAREVKTVQWEKRYIRKDGRLTWVKLTSSLQYDGEGQALHFITLVEDINVQKDAEARLAAAMETLRDNEEKFRLLFNGGNDVVLLHAITPDTGAPVGNFLEVNEIACLRLGYSHAELLQMGPYDIDDPSTPTVDEKNLDFTANGYAVFERIHVTKDGKRIPVEINARKLIYHGQTMMLAICRDITERTIMEAALVRSNAELEQFAYVVSHDLRQPLRMVTSYMSLLKNKLGDTLDEDGRKFIYFAVDGARRMDSLILGLLEYSRAGRVDRAMSPLPLAQVVREALINLEIVIQEAGADIQVAENLPTVNGNPQELVRLFQNLIGNAVKYRIVDRPPVIRIDWRDGGPEWVICVHDNGIGMDSKDFERAFGIFQRLVTSQQYEGTGIGLAICKKIVEHHGGKIWIESAPGVGSTFSTTFPKLK